MWEMGVKEVNRGERKGETWERGVKNEGNGSKR